MQVAPALRILGPEEAEERARDRQAWGDLWRAIARETDADRSDEPRNDDPETDKRDDEGRPDEAA